MNNLKNKDLPAVPAYWYDYDSAGIQVVREQSFGLTKREQIAAMALQGILANKKYEAPRRNKLIGMAEDAVSAADALLETLDT